ncbi:MAG: XRE family transcriptional regulator [Anaerobutyricum hallii]
MEKRCSFELFKSNVCHWLKEEGDIDFLIQVFESDLIRKYYNRKWYLESFYLLGMFDYICRINDAPICSEYDDLRRQRMQEIIYPTGVLLTARVLGDESIKEQALKEAIPEILRFNIVESDIRNVI